MRARAISTKFLTPGYLHCLLARFCQNCFPATFGGHLEFLRRTQNRVYLGNGESDFDKIFDAQGTRRVYWQVFAKIVFPPLLAAILSFCVEHKIVFILETERAYVISIKFLTHRVFTESTCDYSHNQHKNTFISETEQARAISTKFVTHRVSAGTFLKRCFPATFGGHVEFLHKMQKCVYLGIGGR